MKTGFKKIALFTAFGLVMALIGGITINKVAAQTAQDCNSSSPSFWGWIACYIGSPSQGIANAPTLFQGQKAIYDRIGTNSGSTGIVRLAGHGVYLEKKGSSEYFGEIFPVDYPDDVIAGKMWDRKVGSGSGIPLAALSILQNSAKVVIVPSEQTIIKYNLTITRNNISVAPNFCFLETNLVQSTDAQPRVDVQNGLIRTKSIILGCSYYPSMCQTVQDTSSDKCLTPSELEHALYTYTAATPALDMYQIRIK
ncbi:MAG: hypothetical protein AAB482_04100 [Patescibacteria group bacterium]